MGIVIVSKFHIRCRSARPLLCLLAISASSNYILAFLFYHIFTINTSIFLKNIQNFIPTNSRTPVLLARVFFEMRTSTMEIAVRTALKAGANN